VVGVNAALVVSLDQTISLDNLSRCCGSSATLRGLGAKLLERAAIDSRYCDAQTVFFALTGERSDGHNFIDSLFGAVGAVVVRSTWALDHAELCDALVQSGCGVITVDDPLMALQSWARGRVQSLKSLRRIGITGSSGKTTVKEMTQAVLSVAYKVWASPGNMNSVIGLPLALLAMAADTEIAICEMGISEPGEMAVLAGIIFPDLALITNIGTAHIGNFGTQLAIAEEKISICQNFLPEHRLFFPADCPYEQLVRQRCVGQVCIYGESVLPADQFYWQAIADGQRLVYAQTVLDLPLRGEHIRNDALGVIALARDLGLSMDQIVVGFSRFTVPPGRGQVHAGAITVVDDCYNANPDSMAQAILAAVESNTQIQAQGGRLVLVLGDMLELGDLSISAHQRIGQIAAASNAQLSVFYGPQMAVAYQAFQERQSSVGAGLYYREFTELADQLPAYLRENDYLILKASRGMALERLMPVIKEHMAKIVTKESMGV
jgi:UDP-N-acetylmuramoyl-tripeptide--D-alanyl-D-alanine ligase